mmetsp:Transcript_13861/g.59333  ORF Transcript_13861/g.59333 Transcript_13861/m.59333 type:complete len:298 (-) Transcript_13861:406-1299(-)
MLSATPGLDARDRRSNARRRRSTSLEDTSSSSSSSSASASEKAFSPVWYPRLPVDASSYSNPSGSIPIVGRVLSRPGDAPPPPPCDARVTDDCSALCRARRAPRDSGASADQRKPDSAVSVSARFFVASRGSEPNASEPSPSRSLRESPRSFRSFRGSPALSRLERDSPEDDSPEDDSSHASARVNFCSKRTSRTPAADSIARRADDGYENAFDAPLFGLVVVVVVVVRFFSPLANRAVTSGSFASSSERVSSNATTAKSVGNAAALFLRSTKVHGKRAGASSRLFFSSRSSAKAFP